MGMTATRLRERRAAEIAAAPRQAPARQETDAEHIDRLRQENAKLRARIAQLEAALPAQEKPSELEQKAPEQPKPEPNRHQQQPKRRG